MKTRCVISLIVVAAFMILSQPAIADDLADLKATHQRLQKAWNTSDMITVFEIWQDGGISIPSSHAFPMVTNSAIGLKIFTKWLETHTFRVMWYKMDYRVIGNTGLVWGVITTTTVSKTKGTGTRSFNKISLVFVKSEGKWMLVMSHSTPIPSEVKFE